MKLAPLIVSLGLGLAATPGLLAALRRLGRVRPNYRGAPAAHPTGLLLVAASILALASLAILDRLTGFEALAPRTPAAALFVLGVATLGLVDDLLGDRRAGAPRGLRGHLRSLAEGRPSTGALKAAGTAALALYVLAGRGLEPAEYLASALLLTLTAHVFNLLDLRPGRSIKALLVLGAALTVGSLDPLPLWTLGIFVGPALALLPLDLREGGMLGDTGASAIGATAGLWLVLTLPPIGQAIALLAVAALATYGEFRSIATLVDRKPALRKLDSLGRTHA